MRLAKVANQKPLLVVLAVLSLVFAILVWMAVRVFHNYPICMDGYNYLYQAQIFASGHRYLNIKKALKPLIELFMVYNNGHIFSKYAPGFSAVLALGVLLGVPFIVNPLLGCLSLFVSFLTLRTTVSSASALIVIILFAFNSYFLGYSASYFSQPLALFLASCVFYFLWRYLQKDSYGNLRIAACFAAAAFLVRPLDAFCLCLTIGMAMLMALKKQPFRQIVKEGVFIAGIMLLGVLALFLYNYSLTGCFCIANYPIWDYEFKVIDANASGVWDDIGRVASSYYHSLRQYSWPNFISCLVPVLGVCVLLLSATGLLFYWNRLCVLCVTFVASIILLYNFHPTMGWPIYGARYWYPLLAPLVLLAGYGIEAIKRYAKPYGLAVVVIIALGLQFMRLQQDIQNYGGRFTNILKVRQEIITQCPLPSIIVLDSLKNKSNTLRHASGPSWNFVQWWNLKRNPFLNGKRLFVNSIGDALLIAPYYPQYNICL